MVSRATDEADVVTVAWQHPDSDDEDIRCTAPPRGQSSMPAGEFLDAVRRFDREFLDTMSPRVAEAPETDWPAVRTGAQKLLP